jgi:hypothetical protein
MAVDSLSEKIDKPGLRAPAPRPSYLTYDAAVAAAKLVIDELLDKKPK